MDIEAMRILMITNLYPPIAVGGYEISCEEMTVELRRRGHDVVVLTSSRGVDHARSEGNVHRLLFFNTLNRSNRLKLPFNLHERYNQFQWAFKSRRNYRLARKFMASAGFDLAVIWNMESVGVGPVLAAQDCNIPTVFNIEDDWLLRLKSRLYDEPNPVKKRYQAMLAGLSDFFQLDTRHLVAASRCLERAYVSNGFSGEGIRVIPLGIESGLILSAGELHDLPHKHRGIVRLLFVGRIVPEKAPDIAIDALGILKREFGVQDIKLDIIGQGPEKYMTDLKNRVSELGLDDSVEFCGWLDHSLVFEKYSEYDVLLFPSRWEEPFGKIVLEAMAQGLPVIASRRGGPQEVISDGENGLLVTVDDAGELARSILRLLNSDELVRKIRVAGIETVKGQYTLERIADENLEYFKSILSSHAKHS